MKTWYNELGFFSNPFSIKPSSFNNELFGNSSEVSKIIEKMQENGMILISGEFGVGKTSVLKKLIAEFKGNFFKGKKVIYYNCNQSNKSIDYDKLLINAGGFFTRLFRIRKKNMILFLDEMQDMNKKDFKKLKEYYYDSFFKTVVLVSKYDDLELGEELESLIADDKFQLGNMTKTQAIEMIRNRVGNLKFLSDDIIIKIFNTNKNARTFLKNCEDVCRASFEAGEEEVSLTKVKEILV
ncbi:MAG: ATP-binding protein [Candidatus Pacearchaeota archaeon]|nr:ATP-binding protein [Candidatus Pacearchaeota archaeon]